MPVPIFSEMAITNLNNYKYFFAYFRTAPLVYIFVKFGLSFELQKRNWNPAGRNKSQQNSEEKNDFYEKYLQED